MSDNKINNISFSSFLRVFDLGFYDKIKEDLVCKISKRAFDLALSTNIEILSGKVFYNFFKIISEDFDKECIKGFEEIIKTKNNHHLAKYHSKSEKKVNDKEKFINQFTTLQSEIADKAGITTDRLSKILTEKVKDFYAYEVISIALSQGISPLSAFEQLYKTPLTDADILREPKKKSTKSK